MLLSLSPGARYLIDAAFCMAATVYSTVINTVVCTELNAPPALSAKAVAAIETLSGTSHKLYPSWSPKAYQKPCNLPPTASMYSLAATRRSCGFLMSFAHVAGVRGPVLERAPRPSTPQACGCIREHAADRPCPGAMTLWLQTLAAGVYASSIGCEPRPARSRSGHRSPAARCLWSWAVSTSTHL